MVTDTNLAGKVRTNTTRHSTPLRDTGPSNTAAQRYRLHCQTTNRSSYCSTAAVVYLFVQIFSLQSGYGSIYIVWSGSSLELITDLIVDRYVGLDKNKY